MQADLAGEGDVDDELGVCVRDEFRVGIEARGPGLRADGAASVGVGFVEGADGGVVELGVEEGLVRRGEVVGVVVRAVGMGAVRVRVGVLVVAVVGHAGVG